MLEAITRDNFKEFYKRKGELWERRNCETLSSLGEDGTPTHERISCKEHFQRRIAEAEQFAAMPDSEVLRIAYMEAAEEEQAELSELLEKNGEGELTDQESARLDEIMKDCEK